MDTGLRGKTALITGGSSGIGKGISLALAEEGVDLAVASRSPDEAGLEEIRSKGVRCLRIEADVSREADTVRMVRQAIEGLGRIDLFVNNAAWAWHQPVTRIDSEAWYATLDTNLSACMWACREVCRHMVARRQGSIVVVGSTSRFTISYRELAYRISKTGLRVLVENFAVEMAPYGIRVNMVTPGHFRTRFTSTTPPAIEEKLLGIIPAHRFGPPEAVGRAAAFLLSDSLSPYTYGADIVIDGGLALRPLPFLDEREVFELNCPPGGYDDATPTPSH
jgi:NAD(P)-dependent dehydrogenase (short-subunit alcohol dehydrogenase family)